MSKITASVLGLLFAATSLSAALYPKVHSVHNVEGTNCKIIIYGIYSDNGTAQNLSDDVLLGTFAAAVGGCLGLGGKEMPHAETIRHVGEAAQTIDAELYPNPVQSVLNVRLRSAQATGDLQAHVLNMDGQLVPVGGRRQDDVLQLNVTDLAKGMYLLVISDGNQNTATYKFVKL